jgi:adenylosuccinate synthase
MTEEVKHKNGDVYPSQFASMDTLNVSILRHLCPHVFSKDEFGKRSDLLKKLINYHESLTGRTVDQTQEQVARSAKKGIFQEGSQYFSSVEGQGMYKYIGSSHGDGYIIPDEPNEEGEEANLYVS